jgi:crossover junction endodeoxyribonuclease RuvC
LPNSLKASRPEPLSVNGPGELRTLGIDPGLIVCGWGVVSGQTAPRFVACGAIRPRPKDPIGVRLLQLHDAIAGLIAEHSPSEVAIEEQFVGALDPRSALAIGQARAAAVMAAARAGLEVAFYAPAAVKSAVSGYGQSDKGQVQAMVRMLLSLPSDPQPADAADALAIALTHIANRRTTQLVAR